MNPTLDLQPQAYTISFDPANHRYFLGPEGRELPSVTTVLKDQGFIDFSMVPADALETARRRGTEVHRLLESTDRGGKPAYPATYDGYVFAWDTFCIDAGFFVIHDEIEKPVWNTHYFYAGTPDRIGKIGEEFVIVDFKTGPIEPSHAIQLAAYAYCFQQPLMYRRIALKLNDDGTYKVHEFPRSEMRRDFEYFLAALSSWTWRRQHNLIRSK